MLYSGDDFYDDDVTSGKLRRNDIEELDEREINFDEAAAEARAPLIVESANFYDDGPEPDGDEGLDLPDPLDHLTPEELAQLEAGQTDLTPQQELYRANMRRARQTAADNLRAARKLHRQGDRRGTEFLEKYRRAVDWGARNPNPDRRAALLAWAEQLEGTLTMTEQSRAERRTSFTLEQWEQGEEMLQTLRSGITNTRALADAARY